MKDCQLKSGLKIKIRPYRHPDDFEAIAQINKLSLRVSFMYLYEPFARKFPDLFLIAEDVENFKKVGFVLIEIDGLKNKKHSSLIYAIAIHPNYRRQGIGKLLIDGVVESLRSNHKKVKTIFLHVQESNNEALEFYKDYGFEEKVFIEDFYSWGESAHRLVYEL